METSAPNTFRQNLILTAGAVVLGVTFNYLFFEHEPGVSFFLFILLGLLIFYALHAYFRPHSKPRVGLSMVILFFSLMVTVRASALLTVLNVLLVFYLLLVFTREAKGQHSRPFLIKDYILTAIIPLLAFVVNSIRTLAQLLSFEGVLGKKETTSQVLKGIIMAVPILLLFLWLFASADLAFNSFLNSLGHLDLPGEFVAQMVLIVVITLASLGALAYVFKDSFREPTLPPSQFKFQGSVVEVSVFLGLINALFLLFIVFQIRYLFGGEANIVQQGYTYAEYAHRGFTELIIVAVLSLVMIMAAERYVGRRQERHASSFKALSLVLIAQVIVLMVSAFKRLDIYQEAYGFTNLRFYVSAFIVWLSVLFIIFGYKIFQNKQDQFFARAIFVAVIVFMAVMNGINPEALIARQNIKHLAKTGKLDVGYLDVLSADAVPTIMPLLDYPDEQVRRAVGYSLYLRHRDQQSSDYSWQETNWSRSRAAHLLNDKADLLEQYKNFSDDFYSSGRD